MAATVQGLADANHVPFVKHSSEAQPSAQCLELSEAAFPSLPCHTAALHFKCPMWTAVESLLTKFSFYLLPLPRLSSEEEDCSESPRMQNLQDPWATIPHRAATLYMLESFHLHSKKETDKREGNQKRSALML